MSQMTSSNYNQHPVEQTSVDEWQGVNSGWFLSIKVGLQVSPTSHQESLFFVYSSKLLGFFISLFLNFKDFFFLKN